MFDKMNINPIALTILTLLSRSPDSEHYVREISRLTGASLGGCHNALKELQGLDLVIPRKSGRNLYYRVNGVNPAIKHFKIMASLLEIMEPVKLLKPMCAKIMMFGSCASGTDTLESDVDILIVTQEEAKVRSILKSVKSSRPIQAVVFTPGKLVISREKDPAFHAEVDKGIVLYRAEDERV